MISENSRDLLLLLQFIHVRGFTDPSSVTVDASKLQDIPKEWFNHKSTQLSIQQGHLNLTEPPTVEQVVETYKELLALNPECTTTTELANKYYFQRISETERELEQNRENFRELLAENQAA